MVLEEKKFDRSLEKDPSSENAEPRGKKFHRPFLKFIDSAKKALGRFSLFFGAAKMFFLLQTSKGRLEFR